MKFSVTPTETQEESNGYPAVSIEVPGNDLDINDAILAITALLYGMTFSHALIVEGMKTWVENNIPSQEERKKK